MPVVFRGLISIRRPPGFQIRRDSNPQLHPTLASKLCRPVGCQQELVGSRRDAFSLTYLAGRSGCTHQFAPTLSHPPFAFLTGDDLSLFCPGRGIISTLPQDVSGDREGLRAVNSTDPPKGSRTMTSLKRGGSPDRYEKLYDL